jgi:hypothetical protein
MPGAELLGDVLRTLVASGLVAWPIAVLALAALALVYHLGRRVHARARAVGPPSPSPLDDPAAGAPPIPLDAAGGAELRQRPPGPDEWVG